MAAGDNKQSGTKVPFRSHMWRFLGDLLTRPLDAISRRDVEARFHFIIEKNGWVGPRS